jgi:hypothetical protein
MASSDDIKKPERSADSESFASAPTLEQAKLNDDKYVSPLPPESASAMFGTAN